MKHKILFVCLGNICRSPAAEAVFLQLIKDRKISNDFYLESAGTGSWHVGKKSDHRMRIAAKKRDIEITSIARQISITDFDHFDYIITMDNDNLLEVKSLLSESGLKSDVIIRPLLSYSNSNQTMEVPDPYYGGDSAFDEVLDLLDQACKDFLESFNLEN